METDRRKAVTYGPRHHRNLHARRVTELGYGLGSRVRDGLRLRTIFIGLGLGLGYGLGLRIG
jgi:hypothetical protein